MGESQLSLDDKINKVRIPDDKECPIKNGIIYDYYDSDGHKVMFIVRTEDKRFFPLTYTDQGDFVMEAWPGKALYRSEKIKSEGPVIVVEGEKAAEAAAEIFKNGSVVSWPGGANGYSRGDWELLEDREVVLWPDNDDAGRSCMLEIGKLINSYDVSIVDVSSLPPKYDLADDIPKEKIKELYMKRELLKKDSISAALSISEFRSKIADVKEGLGLGWEGTDSKVRLPQSGLVVIGGRSGHGKSTMMINIAVNLLKELEDRQIVFYSYEMPAYRVLLKFLMCIHGIEMHPHAHKNEEMYREAVINDELDAVRFLEKKMNKQFHLTDSPDNLATLVKTLDSRRFENAIVFIDYIQIIPIPEGASRYLAIKKSADTLRALANKRNMVIITGSQLTDGETPYQDTVREGKDITNAAELELKVWNKVAAEARGAFKEKTNRETKEKEKEAYYEDVPGNFAVQVVKNRNGDVGTKFGFDLRFGSKLVEKTADTMYKDF